MTKRHKKTEQKKPPEKAPEQVDTEQSVDYRDPEGQQADPLDEMRERANQATDRALRSQAELENYRKRAAREMDEQRRYANLYLMRDLLPVLDNVQRALEAADNSGDAAGGLVEGFKMVAEQLQAVLKQYNCEEIAALGEPFDPHLHEAVLQQPSEDYEPGTVMQVLQAGFQLHDRVVRPTQVIVSAGSAAQEEESTDDQADSDNPDSGETEGENNADV